MYTAEIASNVTTTVGQDIQLSCPNVGNAMLHRIRWWKGKDRIVLDGSVLYGFKGGISFDSATGTLIIYNASLEDSGVYFCGDGFPVNEILLIVLGKVINSFIRLLNCLFKTRSSILAQD